jgi:hypothetical protein
LGTSPHHHPDVKFLHNDFEGHENLQLANWKIFSKKKEFLGLGVPEDLANVNVFLLIL